MRESQRSQLDSQTNNVFVNRRGVATKRYVVFVGANGKFADGNEVSAVCPDDGGVPVSTGVWRRDKRADVPDILKTGNL